MPDHDWLGGRELNPVWRRLRDRLERNGGQASGRLVVAVATREERHALGALLGRPVVDDRVRLDLMELERRLAERTAYRSLAEAVEAITGGPLQDRRRERERRLTRRQAPFELARSLADEPWVEPWLEGLRRSGALSRAADGEALVRAAVTVLLAVLQCGETGSRVELAARLLGDAHALDEDTELHGVVLRGLAVAAGVDPPTGVAARRALWELHGVTADLVSATCLTLGLRPAGTSPLECRMNAAAESGDPVHVTAWDLRRYSPSVSRRGPVLACENPRVLEAVAERFAGAVPVVCTSGQPNTVVLAVLQWLGEGGASLRYHGDFDWPGIAIANRLVGQCGVQPWFMGTADYEGGVGAGGVRLTGAPVEPSWDAELGAAMRTHGVAVHEEALLEGLLDALEHSW